LSIKYHICRAVLQSPFGVYGMTAHRPICSTEFGISIALDLIFDVSLSNRSNCEGALTVTNIIEVQSAKQRFSRSSTEAGMFTPVNDEHFQSA
jgi:hypothetical protein